MDSEFQENSMDLEDLRKQLELPDSIELIERNKENEPKEYETSTVKLTDGTEIDTRTKKEQQETQEQSPFVYSKAYINSCGEYVPSQIKGVYTEAMDELGYRDVVEDLGRWKQQEREYSCAVQVQKWIISEETDKEFSEAELREIGFEKGWYSDNQGTYLEDIGKLSEINGLKYERFDNLSMDELIALKSTGANIILGVDSQLLGRPSLPKEFKVNHAVELIGFDFSDKENPKVILNNPGRSSGRGEVYPMDIFERAACKVDEQTGEKSVYFATAVYGRGDKK